LSASADTWRGLRSSTKPKPINFILHTQKPLIFEARKTEKAVEYEISQSTAFLNL
jgi:hypothetical protein